VNAQTNTYTNSKRVLVVDDSGTMRSIHRGILKMLGHEDVIEARDGSEALDKLAVFTPDLVLVDWKMPKMDGLLFVRALRSKGIDAPVIMISAEADREGVVAAIRAGVSAFVVKPFTPDVLSQRIAEFLPQGQKQELLLAR